MTQDSAKRQNTESKSKVKANVKPRPSSAEAAPGPSLTKEEWVAGLPLPASRIPSGFLPSSKFQPQAVTALSDDCKAEAVKEWILLEYKSRPRFARLLRLEMLQKNDKLLAAYLGFNTVPQLYYFVHFQGKDLRFVVTLRTELHYYYFFDMC